MRIDDLHLPFAVSEIGNTSGDPAIFLPGGPCRGIEYLGDLAGVGNDRALVVMHPRGTPRSPGLSRGWWTDAEDVVALADALGLGAMDIVAHSAGTRLALATAARFPERVRSLALITPPASWLTGTPSDMDVLANRRSERAVHEALEAMKTDDPSSEPEFARSFRRQAPASYARWTSVEQAHAEVGDVSLAAALAWFDHIPADAAENIQAMAAPPALVIGGDQDLLTGVQPVRDYARALGAETAFVRDCGHYPWVEQPEEFRRILRRWFLTHPGE